TGAGQFWVGLDTAFARYNSVAAFEPGWSPSCPGCYARTPGQAQLPRFDASADGAAGAQGCVAAFADTQLTSWTQYPCANAPARLKVICEREPVGVRSRACDAGVCLDLAWTHRAKRYVYREDAATADSAEQQCATLGGSLIVLQSQDEREQLWRELSHMAVVPDAIWIGLSRVAAAGPAPQWTWDDDASSDAYPSPWGDRQPRAIGPATTTRAFLLHQGSPPSLDDTLAHNDVPEAELPFVCQF
ncbi:MAG: C-type lectin domain-containing protein, partial [Myxococcota bacterium]|nr:C-type lectin domain-containing protein [Myxococcota bacterium]